MPNIKNNFKWYLEFSTPEQQLCEINCLIKEFNKCYLPCPNINKKISMLSQLKILKKSID